MSLLIFLLTTKTEPKDLAISTTLITMASTDRDVFICNAPPDLDAMTAKAAFDGFYKVFVLVSFIVQKTLI